MMHSQALARHRYLLQVCFVAAATTACLFIRDALAFRSLVDLVWMMGLPIAVGMVASIGWDRRCFMSMALLGVSLVVGMSVGVNFTSYG